MRASLPTPGRSILLHLSVGDAYSYGVPRGTPGTSPSRGYNIGTPSCDSYHCDSYRSTIEWVESKLAGPLCLQTRSSLTHVDQHTIFVIDKRLYTTLKLNAPRRITAIEAHERLVYNE